MRQKSKTCYGANGSPLMEYGSWGEAESGAAHVKEQYGNDVHPYACDSCGYFHLGPKERAPGRTCEYCTSEDGVNKDIYDTEGDARRMVETKKRRGVSLKHYMCPVGNGWHLTKL